MPMKHSLGLALVVFSWAATAWGDMTLGTQVDAQTGVNYTVTSTGDWNQNLSELQIEITRGRAINTLKMRTGKQKTVGQVNDLLHKAFQRFLAGQAPGTVVGTLGNIKYGGDVAFVVESDETLRFDFRNTDGTGHSSRFNRADATALAAIFGAH